MSTGQKVNENGSLARPGVIPPPIISNEDERMKALHHYAILDSLPEQAYDDIVLLASQICGAPIATMTLVDRDRQWFKAFLGIESVDMPRDYSFCAHAITQPDEVMVVTDARKDARFYDNPMVTGDPHVGFYAGAPLVTEDGFALGTLCVVDRKPRGLSGDQREALEALSRQIMAQLELRVKMRELNESEQRFQAFMNNSPTLTFIKDRQGRYVYVNQPYLKQFGMKWEELSGRTDADFWPAQAAKLYREHDISVLKGGVPVRMSEETLSPEGQKTHWMVIRFPLPHDNETLLGGVAVDVTQSKIYEQQLEEARRQLQQFNDQLEAANEQLEATNDQLELANTQLALQTTTDALTGIENRRAFDAHLEVEWQRARRSGNSLSLFMIDIDRFKSINDTFGHPAGDAVLRQVAQILKNTARVSDMVCRFGGEEFAVLSPDTTREGARILAERFRVAIESATWEFRPITISVGTATARFQSENTPNYAQTSQMLEAADRALYEAKEAGRNRVMAAE